MSYKDIQSRRLSQYILSLIPWKGYQFQREQQVLYRFITRGDKGGFTGIAIYSSLYTWRIARVDTYKEGKRVKGVFLLDAKNESEFREKLEKTREQLSMLSLQKRKRLLSRGEYDYDGGWLDEVVVTPENLWDGVGADGMTNEEWLENTRLGGDVDPQPESDPEVPDFSEENSYIPNKEPEKSNTPKMSGFNGVEEGKIQNAANKVAQLVPGIELKGINVVKGTGSSGNASINNVGQIILYDRFFNRLTEFDRPAVLYHEIYHLQHGHGNVSTEKIQVEEQMNEPSMELKQIIMEDLKKDMPNIDEKTLEFYYQDYLSVYAVRCPEYYENELETYKAERLFFSDDLVSNSYGIDRQKAEWEYQERLEISKKYK